MRRTMTSLHSITSQFRTISSTKPTLSSFITRRFYSDDIFGDINSKSESSRSKFESADDFEKRLFGSDSKKGGVGGGEGPISDSFYRKLDGVERAHGRSSGGVLGSGSMMDDGGVDQTFDSLSDGLDDRLKKVAKTFQAGDGVIDDNYSFRPDAPSLPGATYQSRDRDLARPGMPGMQRNFRRRGFETTTKEVLRKADFRNIRFLANFLTESGIIIKRSTTKISAKAQRKVAREIKTARAFGLMPFTTMGTKPFFAGKSMEEIEEDYEYDTYQDDADVAAEPVVER